MRARELLGEGVGVEDRRDLAHERFPSGMFEDAGERYHGRSVLRKPYWCAMRFRECDGRRRLLARLERAAVVWNRRLSRPRFRREIGRASCRERVCQYV